MTGDGFVARPAGTRHSKLSWALMPNRHFPDGAPTGQLVDPCWQLECRSGRNSKTHLGSSDDAFYYSRLNSRCVQGRPGFSRQCTSNSLRFQAKADLWLEWAVPVETPSPSNPLEAPSKRFAPFALPPLEEGERSPERVRAACGALPRMLALLAEELERASFQRHHDVARMLVG